MTLHDDGFFMRKAIGLAQKAAALGEIPVGALVVDHQTGQIIGQGYNRRQTDNDPTAHAEIMAITKAGKAKGDWRLSEATLYVTLEPCAMCTGAIINARIGRVVYGAAEENTGCCGSVCNLLAMPFSHQPVLITGVLAGECKILLETFFRIRREKLLESQI